MPLSELDNLYKTTISKLPVAQRLWYCNVHLSKLKEVLQHNNSILSEVQKQDIENLILATNEEINTLKSLTQ